MRTLKQSAPEMGGNDAATQDRRTNRRVPEYLRLLEIAGSDLIGALRMVKLGREERDGHMMAIEEMFARLESELTAIDGDGRALSHHDRLYNLKFTLFLKAMFKVLQLTKEGADDPDLRKGKNYRLNPPHSDLIRKITRPLARTIAEAYQNKP